MKIAKTNGSEPREAHFRTNPERLLAIFMQRNKVSAFLSKADTLLLAEDMGLEPTGLLHLT